LLRWEELVSEALAMTRPDVEELVKIDRRARKEPVLGEVVDAGEEEDMHLRTETADALSVQTTSCERAVS